MESASFGESYTGGYRLGTNVEMAHQAVADELEKMAAGLRGMGTSVEEFSKDMERTTEQTTATMTLIQAVHRLRGRARLRLRPVHPADRGGLRP